MGVWGGRGVHRGLRGEKPLEGATAPEENAAANQGNVQTRVMQKTTESGHVSQPDDF